MVRRLTKALTSRAAPFENAPTLELSRIAGIAFFGCAELVPVGAPDPV